MPEWHLKEQNAFFNLRTSVEADCLESAKPMTFQEQEPSDYEHQFNKITYKKGFFELMLKKY